MRFRAGIALLLCAAAAAVFTVTEAARWLRPAADPELPEEVYAPFAARASEAEYVLRSDGDYVAVYAGSRDRSPLQTTEIELSCLRRADQAMLRAGLPVSSRRELLLLLEDLGS